MSKDKPHDMEVGGEEGSNIYYCPECNEEQAFPLPMCPKCNIPLKAKPNVDPEIKTKKKPGVDPQI